MVGSLHDDQILASKHIDLNACSTSFQLRVGLTSKPPRGEQVRVVAAVMSAHIIGKDCIKSVSMQSDAIAAVHSCGVHTDGRQGHEVPLSMPQAAYHPSQALRLCAVHEASPITLAPACKSRSMCGVGPQGQHQLASSGCTVNKEQSLAAGAQGFASRCRPVDTQSGSVDKPPYLGLQIHDDHMCHLAQAAAGERAHITTHTLETQSVPQISKEQCHGHVPPRISAGNFFGHMGSHQPSVQLAPTSYPPCSATSASCLPADSEFLNASLEADNDDPHRNDKSAPFRVSKECGDPSMNIQGSDMRQHCQMVDVKPPERIISLQSKVPCIAQVRVLVSSTLAHSYLINRSTIFWPKLFSSCCCGWTPQNSRPLEHN
eukprot:jgi/Ulvmu1/12698/UM095_0002.1